MFVKFIQRKGGEEVVECVRYLTQPIKEGGAHIGWTFFIYEKMDVSMAPSAKYAITDRKNSDIESVYVMNSDGKTVDRFLFHREAE